MRSLGSLALAAGVAFLAVTTCHAEVIIKLRSGLELRATRTWVDGGTVKAQVGTGVIGLPSDSIAEMREIGVPAPAVTAAPAAAHAVGGAPPASASPSPAQVVTRAAASGARGVPTPAAGGTVEEHVPEVPGEDALAKMARLDALSLKTHRELSIARTQGKPQEALEALQRRIDDINAQREATMRRLGQLR